ncbi:Metallo-hydrolase/oxidoreductase [Peniophora sp. CONT]|nr:Metallo-hydrolase/oxidoreductase [Peniophora sp. CONT]
MSSSTLNVISLPPPDKDQAFCVVSAIEAGILSLPSHFIFDSRDVDPASRWDVPCFAFLIQHSATRKYFLFDLGFRKDYERLPPECVSALQNAAPIRVSAHLDDKLREGGLDPAEITQIILSHAHCDHSGDPSRFPRAKIVVHPETAEVASKGYPMDQKSQIAQDLLPGERTRVLDEQAGWSPLGPFRAHDFFGDGSAYVVDAPGHMPGHVNLLLRTSSDGAWLYLAGDAVHDWRLLRGEVRMAMGEDAHGHAFCKMHTNHAEAVKTIANIHALTKVPRVRVLLAHDVPWWEETQGKKGFWPETITSL